MSCSITFEFDAGNYISLIYIHISSFLFWILCLVDFWCLILCCILFVWLIHVFKVSDSGDHNFWCGSSDPCFLRSLLVGPCDHMHHFSIIWNKVLDLNEVLDVLWVGVEAGLIYSPRLCCSQKLSSYLDIKFGQVCIWVHFEIWN